jgi:uncharacterized protein
MNSIYKAGVFALVAIGLLALGGLYAIMTMRADNNKRTFNVQGKGEVEVRANKATISADFVSESKSTKDGGEAITALTETTKKVFAELEKAGVKAQNIKTQNVNTNPKYDYCYSYVNQRYALPDYCKTNPNDQKIIGYTATQNLSVKIEDNKALVEKILGLLPALGARNMNGPNWEVDNKEATKEARMKATAEAKEKAESIAQSLGKKLGDVVYYNEQNVGGGPMPMYAREGMMKSMIAGDSAVSVPVSEGTDKVSITVDITYELK